MKCEVLKHSPPVFFSKVDYFSRALDLYGRAWTLCECMDIGGPEREVLAAETGFLRKVQGDVVGALEMALAGRSEELLQSVLAELAQSAARLLPEECARAAAALETRGGEETLALLRQLAPRHAAAALSLARALARAAGLLPESAARNLLVGELRALAHLGSEVSSSLFCVSIVNLFYLLRQVARLLEQCGDVVLRIAKNDGSENPPILKEIRANRLALVESSPYFEALLAGAFAEGKSSSVVVRSEFPEHVERALHFLYVQFVEILNMSDAIEMLACALEMQLHSLALFCGQYLMECEGELDGDTLASVLLMLGPRGFETLKARLTAKWRAALVAECQANNLEAAAELLGK